MIEFIFVVGITFAFLIYNSISWGLVAYKFWYWFALPLFPALPEITYVQAIGFFVFLALFKNHSAQIIEDKYVDNVKSFILMLIAPWMTLLFGLIIWAIFLQ
jgi:hypothetical protein